MPPCSPELRLQVLTLALRGGELHGIGQLAGLQALEGRTRVLEQGLGVIQPRLRLAVGLFPPPGLRPPVLRLVSLLLQLLLSAARRLQGGVVLTLQVSQPGVTLTHRRQGGRQLLPEPLHVESLPVDGCGDAAAQSWDQASDLAPCGRRRHECRMLRVVQRRAVGKDGGGEGGGRRGIGRRGGHCAPLSRHCTSSRACEEDSAQCQPAAEQHSAQAALERAGGP